MKAAAPNNQTIKIAAYLPTTDNWVTQIQESAKEFGDFSIQINDQNFITDEGFIYLMSYTDSSNGVTPASLEVDYMGLHIGLSVDAQAVLAKSGFVQAEQLNTHVENQDNPHQVTAEQVGLGNVENYGFASDSEAVAGTLTSKYMHPKNVAEAIKGQAVTQTGDQEIAGVKNFVTMPTVNGVPLESSKMAIYEASGVGEVGAKYQAAFNKDNMKFVLIRVGNRVDAFVRCNLSDPTKLNNNLVKVFTVPTGYTLSTKITKGIWNLALTAMQYTFPQPNCAGLYEMGNQGILFGANRAGNIYLQGSWYTDDPFPTK